MSRRVPALLVVPIGVGVMMAVLAATELAAQTVRTPTGLRTTIEADQDDTRARRLGQPKRSTVTDPSPAGQLPSFGTPPGSGAGQTGFVSGKPKRKTKAGSVQTSTPSTQSPPLSLSPSGTSITADKEVAADKAKAKAKQKGAAKKAETAAKPATAPRAPALLQREQARQDFNALPNTAVPLRKRPAEDDPYEQLGIRAGAFLVRPAIETSVGYDTNPKRVENGPGSAFVKVAPELYARSNWLRHEVVVDMRGSQIWYRDTPDQNRPDFDGKVTGRIDVTDFTRGELEARYRVATDNPGSPNLQAGLAELPIFTTIGGSAGIAQRFNRFEVAVKGSAERTEYADSKLTDGTTVSNAGRNFDQYSTLVRGSYELTPGVKPFAQVDFDKRIYDRSTPAG